MLTSAKLAILLLVESIFGCARAKDRPAPVDPPAEITALYQAASQRLITQFLDANTWVVSRHPDGSSEHQGEALIWSGTAMAVLSCDDGSIIETGLQKMILGNNGALDRYQPLGEYVGGREVTLDGALGLYYGVARHITQCPGNGARAWKAVFDKHCAYVSAHQGRLNQAAPATLGGFSYLLTLLSSRIGACNSSEPGDSRGVETAVAGWAFADVQARGAGYRLNLGMTILETLELLGKPISQQGRDEWCAATNGAGIPNIDAYCGRGDLKTWIASFVYNFYEFQFQRASWESPDGNGLQTPGLDLLVALKQAYTL